MTQWRERRKRIYRERQKIDEVRISLKKKDSLIDNQKLEIEKRLDDDD